MDRVVALGMGFLPKGTDPSGIREASSTTVNRVVERYNASGERISNPVKGVNILKMEDGSVRKVVVR